MTGKQLRFYSVNFLILFSLSHAASADENIGRLLVSQCAQCHGTDTNPDTKEVGIALCTITLNAGRITPLHHGLLPHWNEKGLIVTAQATANPLNAHKMFKLWDEGYTFQEIEEKLSSEDPYFSWRQIGAVSAGGDIYGYTGTDAYDHKSHVIGDGSIAIGNFCQGAQPVKSMAAALESGCGSARGRG